MLKRRDSSTMAADRDQDAVGALPSSLDDLPDVLTVDEVARVLRLSRNGAYEAVARREIPSIRIGRRVLVPKRKLLSLINGDE